MARGPRTVWSAAAIVLLLGGVVTLVEVGVFVPWLGILIMTIGTAAIPWVSRRRAHRLLRAVREKAETAVSEGGGEVVRHAGDDADRLASAVAALIRLGGDDRVRRQLIDQELSVVLGTLAEGVVIVDQAGTFLVINESARRMLDAGGSASSTRSPASLRRLVADIRSGAAVVSEVFEHGRPQRWLRATVRPVDGIRTLIVLQDVTADRKVAAMRRDFVADASHELKTPVAALLAASETIQSALPEDPDTAAAFADRLYAEALRLAALVGDLLDLSRLESEAPTGDLVDVATVVKAEMNAREGAFADAGIHLRGDLSPVLARADARELGLAVGNLLDNARTYSEAGSAVDVEVSEDDHRAVVAIRDGGSGIPARDIPRIFERFYRVDTARSRRSGGTGLGLAIVKHVAERHGGGVEVESELGVGSTFRFWIPKA
jgi:signal transduction histidine kinase